MYARFTSTRMKGSAVVQGLKSLAAKLHPQLPLSSKESQRLLTALTTSFRKHLDEVHPPRAVRDDGGLNIKDGIARKSGSQQLHSSSADLADKHLASVLTSPLLSKTSEAKKPTLSYATAVIELQKNPAKDPILLLEEYQAKGAATLGIASLCLETFKANLRTLTKEERHAEIHEVQAGKRTLLWLWETGLYDTDVFADDTRFMDLLMLFLNEEGSEKFFWDWFRLDMPIENSSGKYLKHTPDDAKRLRYPFRWKGRLLRALVHAKLASGSNTSINDALDALFKACDVVEEGRSRGVDEIQFPLNQAAVLLTKTFENPGPLSRNVDPARFDRYIHHAHLYYSGSLGGDAEYPQLQIARLTLIHPSNPSAQPALALLKLVFSERGQDLRVQRYFTKAIDERSMHSHFFFMVRTAALLREHGHKDADWVRSMTLKTYPTLAQRVDKNIHRFQQQYRHSHTLGQRPEHDVEQPPIRHVLFPSLT